MEGLGGQNNPAREIWAQKEKIAWSIRVSIPVPRACKARTLPIELMPQQRVRFYKHRPGMAANRRIRSSGDHFWPFRIHSRAVFERI